MNKGKKPTLIGRLYDKILKLSGHKNAFWVLGGVSFAESSFFPFPPDPILITMCLARPKKAYYYAFWCMVTSVTGGILGYFLGYFLFPGLIHPAMEFLGLSASWMGNGGVESLRVLAGNVPQMVSSDIIQVQSQESLTEFLSAISGQLENYEFYTDGLFFKGILFFNKYGVMTVFVAAFTILPYKLFTISAGLFGQPLLGFIAASCLGRGLRFFLVATLINLFGPSIEPWIRRNLNWLVIAFAAMLLVGILLLKVI